MRIVSPDDVAHFNKRNPTAHNPVRFDDGKDETVRRLHPVELENVIADAIEERAAEQALTQAYNRLEAIRTRKRQTHDFHDLPHAIEIDEETFAVREVGQKQAIRRKGPQNAKA